MARRADEGQRTKGGEPAEPSLAADPQSGCPGDLSHGRGRGRNARTAAVPITSNPYDLVTGGVSTRHFACLSTTSGPRQVRGRRWECQDRLTLLALRMAENLASRRLRTFVSGKAGLESEQQARIKERHSAKSWWNCLRRRAVCVTLLSRTPDVLCLHEAKGSTAWERRERVKDEEKSVERNVACEPRSATGRSSLRRCQVRDRMHAFGPCPRCI